MKKIVVLLALLGTAFCLGAQSIPKWKVTELVNYYSKKSDTVYVINFWATFCKPCVEEIPYLQQIASKFAKQKVKLLLVSLDLKDIYPDSIAHFAKKKNITAGIVWLNESNADYFCPAVDKKWSGSLPSTLFVNAATGYRKFFEEQITANEFEKELKAAIASH